MPYPDNLNTRHPASPYAAAHEETPAERFAAAADAIEGHTITLGNLWDQRHADAFEDAADLAEEVALVLETIISGYEARIINIAMQFASMRPRQHPQPSLFGLGDAA